jgi:pyruvate carboxylase
MLFAAKIYSLINLIISHLSIVTNFNLIVILNQPYYFIQVTIARGKTLGIKTLAMAEDLTANGEREVFFEMNGQLRSVFIKDKEAVKVCSETGVNCKIRSQTSDPRIINFCPFSTEGIHFHTCHRR